MNETTKVGRHAVVNRSRFDDCPGDVTAPADLERWRRFRVDYHRAEDKFDTLDFPLQLDFELNSQCNLACAFCPHGQEKIPKMLLGRERFERAILEGQSHGLVSIKMNYINEPLLVPDFVNHIRFAKAHGVLNVYFATNGVLLNERFREELIDAGASKIMVSLDAATPETFKKIRSSSQYELIVRNVEALLELRAKRGVTWPLVRVNFLKTNLNIHERQAFLDKWTNVADMVGLQDQMGLPGKEDAVLITEDHADLETFRCNFPFKMLVLESGGNILPCCSFSGRSMPLGHIDTSTLKQAWDSERMTALRGLHARAGWRDNPVCKHCVLGA